MSLPYHIEVMKDWFEDRKKAGCENISITANTDIKIPAIRLFILRLKEFYKPDKYIFIMSPQDGIDVINSTIW